MRLTEVLSSYPSSHIIVWAHRRGKILVKIYRLAAWLLFSVMHSSLAYTTLYRQPSFLCSLIKKKCQKVTTSQLKSAPWQNNNRSTEIWPVFHLFFIVFIAEKHVRHANVHARIMPFTRSKWHRFASGWASNQNRWHQKWIPYDWVMLGRRQAS